MKRNLSYKLAIGLIILFLFEGLIKVLIVAFPLTEILSSQGLVAGAWFTKRAFTDTKSFRYMESQNEK